MGSEWSPGPENRSPGFPDHFLASGTGPAAQNRQTPDQPPPATATGNPALGLEGAAAGAESAFGASPSFGATPARGGRD